jgi:hypothetical protein
MFGAGERVATKSSLAFVYAECAEHDLIVASIVSSLQQPWDQAPDRAVRQAAGPPQRESPLLILERVYALGISKRHWWRNPTISPRKQFALIEEAKAVHALKSVTTV